MRNFSDSHATPPTGAEPEQAQAEEALGWEGHVNVPTESPILTKLLQNWPELRTGLAFSMVFVVGALVGGSLALLVGCQKSKTQ
ncbi:MAG: hypothetical protein VST68_09710 [Nitrospirota bacterium]|nr:hypothetical protein [Nitrospirota bacterium]